MVLFKSRQFITAFSIQGPLHSNLRTKFLKKLYKTMNIDLHT